mmetsp:Transcript_80546/g.249924  ORF Transcript_80546/g.249924 Transcript_80546/m.249924 type:complete len:357 (+) Transcript_80546:95-1165(+)
MAHTPQADIDIVAGVLRKSSLPTATSQMLINGLPHVISSKDRPRHGMQEQFAGLVRSTLLDLTTATSERTAACQAGIAAGRGELEAAKAEQEATAQAEQAAAAAVLKKGEELERHRAAKARTESELATAEAARDRVQEAWRELEAQKSTMVSLIGGPLLMLREGGWEDDEARDSAIDAVAKQLKFIGADQALAAAARGALSTRPTARKEFDELVVSATSEFLEGKLASFEQQLLAAAPGREDAEAEAMGLAALSLRERLEELDAHSTLYDAKAAAEAASKTRQDAEATVRTRQDALSEKLTAQVLEDEWAQQLAKAAAAAERLVAFSYKAEGPAAKGAPDQAASADTLSTAAPMGA